MSEFLKKLLALLEKQPWWAKVQPYFLVAFGFVAFELAAYHYIEWRYGYTAKPEAFLRSYVSIRIALVFVGIALVLALFRLRLRPSEPKVPGRLVGALRKNQRLLWYRAVVVGIVAGGVFAAARHFSPSTAGHIRIRFIERIEGFDTSAFAYVVYELNRLQKNWYFEVDFKPYDPGEMTPAQAAACERDDRPYLCYAECAARGEPTICITSHPLGGAYFWERARQLAVISTADRDAYAPISPYKYLAFCVVVQSILIHVESRLGKLPKGWFEPSTESHGGIFQSNPMRPAIRSLILGARLSPSEEEDLFNCFGPEYARICGELLTLEWLDTPRVANNLNQVFQITKEGSD